jgi:hypothetical protein
MYNIGTSLVVADYSCRRISLRRPAETDYTGGGGTLKQRRGGLHISPRWCARSWRSGHRAACSRSASRARRCVAKACPPAQTVRAQPRSTLAEWPGASCRRAAGRTGRLGHASARVGSSGTWIAAACWRAEKTSRRRAREGGAAATYGAAGGREEPPSSLRSVLRVRFRPPDSSGTGLTSTRSGRERITSSSSMYAHFRLCTRRRSVALCLA